MFLSQKFSNSPVLMRIRKFWQKFVDYRFLKRALKSPVLSALTFVLIFFFIYADSIVSNFCPTPSPFQNTEHPDINLSQKVQDLSGSNGTSTDVILLPGNPGDGEIAETNLEDPNMLIPPFNATRIERLAWFREKLPDLEIFNMNPLTERFHARVLEFLNNNCTVQFFMIWNSPALSFKTRDFLAIDSLFSANPRACLLIVSRTLDTRRGYRILKPILDRGFKVLAVTPNLPFLVKNTPTEIWFEQLRSGRRDPGGYIVQNLANLIRLAMLYKYGGVYLDTDFIILKDFSGLRNSVGSQTLEVDTKDWLNGAAMTFDVNHPLVEMFLEEFANTYNGNRWGNNGPHLVTRVIQRVGSTPECNFTVLPPEAFYPADWVKIKRFFRKPVTEEDLRWTEEQLSALENGNSYGIHLWNKHTCRMKIEVGSVMGSLIEKHCVICENIYT